MIFSSPVFTTEKIDRDRLFQDALLLPTYENRHFASYRCMVSSASVFSLKYHPLLFLRYVDAM